MGCNNKGEKVQGYIRNGIFTYHGIPYAAELGDCSEIGQQDL